MTSVTVISSDMGRFINSSPVRNKIVLYIAVWHFSAISQVQPGLYRC